MRAICKARGVLRINWKAQTSVAGSRR